MTVLYPRSLDRPVEFLGLRGRWLMVFALGAGASVLLAAVAGACTSASLGFCLAFLLAAGVFFACRAIQSSVTHRQLTRLSAASGMDVCVRRNETLCRVLLAPEADGRDGGGHAAID